MQGRLKTAGQVAGQAVPIHAPCHMPTINLRVYDSEVQDIG